jgi:uncharacterized membrane protein YecN with MAPEG domain
LEAVTTLVVLQLVASFFFPRLAFVGGIAIIVGRQLYSDGYRKHGAAGRNVGGLISFVASATLLIACIWGRLPVCLSSLPVAMEANSHNS